MKELKFKSYSKVKEISTSGDIGNRTIKIAGWATRITDPVTGEVNVDRDGEIVDFSGFDLEAKVLLAYHDMNRPVGKVQLTKRPDGIWFEAEVFEAMDKQVFFAVEKGIIDSVSIGFQAYDYEFKQVNGEDVLTWTRGSIYETSLISVPSNRLATFDTIKALVKDHSCTGLSCSVKALKEMNPDCGCQMEKETKEEVEVKKLKDIISKGLTWDETENDKWNRYDMLRRYFNIFFETVDDNWFEVMWNEALSGDEVKANVMEAFRMLEEKLMEEFDVQVSSVNKGVKSSNHEKTVITYGRAHKNGTGKADPDTKWDGPAEVSAATVDDLKIMCAYVEEGKEDIKGGYKLAHHKASDGHDVVLKGVQAAIQRLYQTDMPDDERKGVYNHLAKHSRDDFDIEPIKFEDLKKGINIEIDYKNKRMVIKEMENMKIKDIETEQTNEEQPTEEVVPETPPVEEPASNEETDSKEEVTAEVEKPAEEKPKEEVPTKEEPKQEAQKEEEVVPEKEPELVNPAQELIGKLSTFSIDSIDSVEELEAIEDQVEKLREKLDEFYSQVEEQANQIIGENE